MKQLNVPQSGSQANTTASHNRAGQYLRSRRAPVQPIGTGRRAFIRAAFGSAASGFAALTTVEQDAWSSFASSHPITDALGQSITLTGQQMFVSCGTALINCLQPLPTDPPTSAAQDNLAPVTATFSVATGLAISFTPGTAGNFVTGAIMGPFSSAVRFNKTFWQLPGTTGVVDAFSGTLAAATAVIAAQFGTVIIGQWYFVKVTPVNVGGYTGTPTIIRVVTTT